VEQEIFKIMEAYLQQLKCEGMYYPYIPFWNNLRNLYDIPRSRVGHVVQLIKEHVFVLKNELIEQDYDITMSS
jgi:hypothetical protein